MRPRHVLAAVVAAAAFGPATPGASAHPLGDRVLTIPIPDRANPTQPPCDTSFYFGGWPTPYGTSSVVENIKIDASSSSEWCDDVVWSTRVTVIDNSPTHATRTSTASGGSTASTRQVVPYALGVREVGLVTYQFEATSRIWDLCVQDLYVVDWMTRTSTWIPYGVAC